MDDAHDLGERRKRGRPRIREAPTGVRALDRGLALLETLSEAPALQTDVAERIGLPISTTFRLLETLRARRFVERSEASGRYEVGIRAFEVGAAYVAHSTLADRADAVMRGLVEKFNEAVNLAVLDGHDAVYVHQVEGNRVVRFFTQLGARVPLHCTGVGKVLVAWRPDEEVARLLTAAAMVPYTENTLTELSAVIEDLAMVRARGFAVDDEERELGVRCVAAPIRGRNGEVLAAVSLSAPAARLSDTALEVVSADLTAGADAISAGLGWSPDRTSESVVVHPAERTTRAPGPQVLSKVPRPSPGGESSSNTT